jgi:hypothetical protein
MAMGCPVHTHTHAHTHTHMHDFHILVIGLKDLILGTGTRVPA